MRVIKPDNVKMTTNGNTDVLNSLTGFAFFSQIHTQFDKLKDIVIVLTLF